MKITAIDTYLVKLPFAKPITTSIHDIRSVGCVCLEIKTDQGLTGEAYGFTLNTKRLNILDALIQSFDHFLVHQDPHQHARIEQDIWQQLNPIGHKGLTIGAMATINTALWDLVGKYAEQPLHKLFGACRERIWTYASGGLWLSQSIDELIQEAEGFIQEGFGAIKMRVGHDLNTDIMRVTALHNAVGDKIDILLDANQAFTPKQAIRLGKALQHLNIVWLEEPVNAHNLHGHQQVTRTLDIDIASGETEYTRFGMHTMLQQGSCDILMPDLQRVGGLSEMRRTAALASVYHVPISTHIFTEQSLCVAGAEPNCISVEHMPWFSPLFKEPLVIEEGYITIPNRPGIGFSFCPEARQRFSL